MNLLTRGVALLLILGNVVYADDEKIESFLTAIKDANLSHVQNDLKDKEIQESLKKNTEAISKAVLYFDSIKTNEMLKRRERITISLLNAGVDLYYIYLGRSLLEEAIKENYYELTKYLLNKGDIEKLKSISSTNDFLSLVRGKPILELLIKKKLGDLNYRNNSGDTIFHIILSRGLKISHGLDCKNLGVLSQFIGVENGQGYTPLDSFVSYVSDKDEYQCFTDILKQRKSIKEKSGKMYSLLMSMLSRKFSLETYKLVIQKSEDINYKGYEGRTALFKSIEANNDDVTKLLLSKNAHISMLDKNGNSILMSLITSEGNVSIAKLLIDKGIDINVVNEIGKTALFLAKKKNMPELIDILEKKGAKILTQKEVEERQYLKEYVSALNYKNIKTIKKLINSNKISINTTVNGNESPLHSFMRTSGAGNDELLVVINFLIDEGIDLNLGEDTPETLLAKAFEYNRLGIAQKLMNRGAKLEGAEVMSAFTYLEDEAFILKLVKNNPKLLTGRNMFNETLLTKLASKGKKNLKFFNILLASIDINSENKDGTYNNLFRLVEEHGAEAKIKPFVESMFSYGYSAETRLGNGKTLLMVALESSADLDIVKLLTNNSNGFMSSLFNKGKKADLHAKSKDGRKIAHFMALSQKDVLEYMINLGVKVAVHGGTDDVTPLILAVKNNRSENITLLLDKSTINHADKYGKTALNYVMEYDYSYMIKALKDTGATVNTKEYIEKKSTLYSLVKKEPKGLAKILKSGDEKAFLAAYKKVKKVKLDGFIEDLLAYGNLDLFKSLLNNGVSLNKVNKTGFSLLALAVYFNNLDVTKFLLNKKADINALSKEKRSIFLLSTNSSVDMIKFLRKHDINTEEDKENIVNEALRYNNKEVATYLLNEGFPFDIKKVSDSDIINYISEGKDQSIDFLLSQGLDINHKVYYAFHKEPLLIHAIVSWENKVAKLLIRKGADIHALVEYDNGSLFKSPPTALGAAIQRNNKEMVALLLEKGANVDSIDKEEDIAPLLVALQNQHAQLAQMLIAQGCDVNISNEKNKVTPLMYASYYGYFNTVKMLVEHGAKLQMKTPEGKTAYKMAKDNEYELIYEYLMSKI